MNRFADLLVSQVQHDNTEEVGAGLVPMCMISGVSRRESLIAWRGRLARPLAVAAYGVFYASLFAAVVVLPITVVIFGLVILFG